MHRHLMMFLHMFPRISANDVRDLAYNSFGVPDFQMKMSKKHGVWMDDPLAKSLYNVYWSEYSSS